MNLRYIGADGSLGYRTGQVYSLTLITTMTGGIRVMKPAFCPYASDDAFWRNWERP